MRTSRKKMSRASAILLLFLFYVHSSLAFEDQDLSCSGSEHITTFTRKVESGKKSISSKCAPYSPSITEDAVCAVGIAFKCTDDWEGCDDPNAWIGGFQAFDIDPNAEIYVPYCCTSNQVKIDQPKCREVKLMDKNNQNFNYVSVNNRLFSHFRCKYFKSNNQKTVDYMTMSLQECTYNISATSTTSSSVSTSSTSSPIPTTKAVDAGVCFDRFITKNQPLDLVDDNVQIIGTTTATDEKDCASRCLHSDTEYNTRCRSFRYSVADDKAPTCTLRTNYVRNIDQVKWVKERLNVVYGNRSSACDAIKR